MEIDLPEEVKKTLFEPRITLGNVVVLISVLTTGLLWYARAEHHINDKEIHQPLDIGYARSDERIELRVGIRLTEIERRLKSNEDAVKENTKLLYEIRGELKRQDDARGR